jgi:hypothetical protein
MDSNLRSPGHGELRCRPPPGKADPFRLVAVEQLVGRMAGQNRRQFPGKIDGVAIPVFMP